MSPVRISYYSDVLCIWAYATQRRLEELVQQFGDEISIESHFCSVFSDVRGKIEQQWSEKGGFEGYNRHVNDIARKFPHIDVHDRVWLDAQPRTSASPHLFLKAVEIVEKDSLDDDSKSQPYLDRISTHAAWELRRAFFASAKDISDWTV